MANDIYKIIGENINLYRKKHNMKLEVLSRKAGVSVSFLNNIEKGQRKPTLYTIEKIANALNCPLISLLIIKSKIKQLPDETKIVLEIMNLLSHKNLETKKKILEIIKIL